MPTEINYVVGDATSPSGDGAKIICHVCNDIGGWGRGFVLALSARWPEPEAAYRRWFRDASPALGEVQFVDLDGGLTVANMIGQHRVRATKAGPPIRYDALETCLAKLAERAAQTGASVHMPRIGCGLAGGQWTEVEALIEKTLLAAGVPVTVYDLPSS